MKIYLVGGARPNFVKIAALVKAFRKYKKSHPKKKFTLRIIHTGQHYDERMTRVFFKQLQIPKPYINLGVGSSSHGEQTAKIMMKFEKLLSRERANLVIVVGDVNSTVACSLVATKMGIPVAHVEAGLRSFDRTMPEEINRLLTDQISDILFTTCRDANKNLLKEGIPKKKIYFTGNVMVDTLRSYLPRARKLQMRKKLKLGKRYAVLTLHRPSNVDRTQDFKEIVKALEAIQKRIPIVFPVHPRTANQLKKTPLGKKLKKLPCFLMMPPMRYLDFVSLMNDASLILTDSGGIQEEATVLGVPCLTLRDNTERPITISTGTNQLAGRKAAKIIRMANRILNKRSKKKTLQTPPLWDGKAADRIIKILLR